MDILLWIAGVLVMVLAGILGFVVKRQKEMETEMASLRQDVNNNVSEMKTNYLDRFADLKEHTVNKLEIMTKDNNKEFSEIKSLLAVIRSKIDQKPNSV